MQVGSPWETKSWPERCVQLDLHLLLQCFSVRSQLQEKEVAGRIDSFESTGIRLSYNSTYLYSFQYKRGGSFIRIPYNFNSFRLDSFNMDARLGLDGSGACVS